MTTSTRAQLTTEFNTNYADNTIGAITAALARTTFTDFVASLATLGDTNTFTTANTFSPASGDAITINGVAASNSKAISVTQSGPASGSVAGPINLNLLTVSSYNAGATAGSKFGDNGWWTSAISAFRVNFNVGGANLTGAEPFAGIVGHLRITTASTATGGTDFEGVTGLVYTNAAMTGSTFTEGVVGASVADASANITGGIVGVFAEADIINGGVVAERRGLSVDSEGTGRATNVDAMIHLSALNNTGNYKTGIMISTSGGGQPVMSTGDFFASTGASSGAFTLANFINLPNMTVTGQLISTQKFNVRGTDGFTNIGNAVTPDALLTINGNTVATAVAPSATTYLHVVGATDAIARIAIDAFGTGAAAGVGNVLNARYARGTAAAPTATLLNDFIFVFGSSGYQGGGAYGSGTAQIAFQATENFSAGHNGQNIQFSTVPTSSGTVALAVTIQASGGMSVGTAADPGINNMAATAYKSGSNQVVGARVTGYGAMTGTPDKATAFATSTVTLAQLAGRVMQLQADLTTHGLIGP